MVGSHTVPWSDASHFPGKLSCLNKSGEAHTVIICLTSPGFCRCSVLGWELPGIDVVDEAAVVAVGPGAVEGESLEHQLSSLF